jgi:hypothetical protein
MKLEKIEQLTATNGAQYFKLTIDGKNYNYFADSLNLSAGDEVECTFEKNGKFTNLEEIKKATSTGSSGVASTSNVVLTRTDKPHSYEFGEAKNRHKIYYNEVEELLNHIEILKNAGLLNEEIGLEKIN